MTIEVTNFADDIFNTGTVSSDSLNLILTDDFAHNSTSFNGFTNFSNLAITTAGNYTQGAAIDIAGDISIQASGEASLDDNASIKARNLFFSAYKIYNQADITITENATFDIENDFLNGFYFDGTGTVVEILLQVTSMLQQELIFLTTFLEQSMQITSMLHQEVIFTILVGND